MRRWQEPGEEDERYFGLTPLQFNLAVFLVLGLVGLAAFLFFGGAGIVEDNLFGDEESSAARKADPTADDAATPTPTVAPATPEEAAEAALLSIYDLPLGWRKEPTEDVPDLALSADCALLNEDLPPGGTPTLESDTFAGPADQEATSYASAFPSPGEAATALDGYLAAAARCREELETALENYVVSLLIEDSEEPSASANLTLEQTPYERLADATTTYHLFGDMSVGDVTASVVSDIVFIRAGRLVGALSYAAFDDFDPAEEIAIARKIADKLAKANDSLGE